MRIYLTGFMGSGKTTVGQRLSSTWRIPFVDTDDWIEEQTGLRIPQYFTVYGASAFRRREDDALDATADYDAAVIATGGGMLVDARRMARAKDLGTVVYLQVDTDTLYNRLAPDAAHRPLLWDANDEPLTGDALRTHIAELLDARAPAYERANVQVDAAASPETVARRVQRAVSNVS